MESGASLSIVLKMPEKSVSSLVMGNDPEIGIECVLRPDSRPLRTDLPYSSSI
jgi:hypothetical protein